MRRTLMTATLLTAALTATACTAAPTVGPLQIGGDTGTSCAPGDTGSEVGFGDVGRLDSESAATVKSIDLVNSDGLRLVGAYVAPFTEGQVGLGTFFPEEEESELWSLREDPAGYEIAPGDTVSVLVIAARTGAEAGSAAKIRIVYDVDGTRHEAFTSTEIVIQDRCF